MLYTETGMKKMRQRRRRDERQSDPPVLHLTERDRQVIRAVSEYRVLSQDQVGRLFFGSQTPAQRRLAGLYDHGYLERQFLPVRGGIQQSPILYLLDRRGAELLRAEYGLETVRWQAKDNRVSTDFVEHLLGINEVRIAVTLACRELGYRVLTWLGEAELKADYDRVTLRASSGKRREVPVIPDSYFALETPRGKAHFFLELDRGTMTLKRFQTKVAAYQAYYRSGEYERRYGARSLRVLTVTLGERRLANLKATTEAAGGRGWFWFGLLEQMTADQVLDGTVWQVAGQEGERALIGPL